MIKKKDCKLSRATHTQVEGSAVVECLTTEVIPFSLFLLATRTVLRKAAIDRGVRLATGRYGCRQIHKPSNATVSVLI